MDANEQRARELLAADIGADDPQYAEELRDPKLPTDFFEDARTIRLLAKALAQQAPDDGEDDAAEAAYWRFDARRQGYAEWKNRPMSERDAFKAEYRAATPQAPQPVVGEAEVMLRFMLARAYSGVNLYCDDGEMQDNAAHPHIDFLRDPWQQIEAKIQERKISQPQQGAVAVGFVHDDGYFGAHATTALGKLPPGEYNLYTTIGQQVPAEGEWVLVPREATPEMIEAGIMFGTSPNKACIIYQSMLAATPQAPAADGECPYATRCACLGACKHGLSATGAIPAPQAPQPVVDDTIGQQAVDDACNCPGGTKPASLHAPNCPVRAPKDDAALAAHGKGG